MISPRTVPAGLHPAAASRVRFRVQRRRLRAAGVVMVRAGVPAAEVLSARVLAVFCRFSPGTYPTLPETRPMWARLDSLLIVLAAVVAAALLFVAGRRSPQGEPSGDRRSRVALLRAAITPTRGPDRCSLHRPSARVRVA